ncbi:hypothetical protein K504DRAFT_109023 [Pleomassaria siparia CBS 279.74]|uniref:Uncharacterized protein n=1 Tax=Pleomassaria siparia CBS 279.74 TaxID=1314801 RepID=A0A6G1JVP0_9PLEO|nr:hypothetical protein K504DRAFT_109023 [Pleomassaria siparia CBS 279.74]
MQRGLHSELLLRVLLKAPASILPRHCTGSIMQPSRRRCRTWRVGKLIASPADVGFGEATCGVEGWELARRYLARGVPSNTPT